MCRSQQETQQIAKQELLSEETVVLFVCLFV